MPPKIGGAIWFLRWANASRPYYILLAVAVGAAFYFGWILLGWLPHESDGQIYRVNPRLGAVLAALTTTMVWTANWVARGSQSDWMKVATSRSPTDALAKKTFAPGANLLLACTLFGAFMGVLQLWVTGDLSDLRGGAPIQQFGGILVVILFWILAVQVGGLFVAVILGFYRLGSLVEPDLLRQESLTPFSLVGLRILATLAVTITMMLIMVTNIGVSDELDLIGLSVPCGFMVLLAAPCFLLPQLGVRNNIRRTRRRMLRQLDQHLDAADFPNPPSLESPASIQRIGELTSLRERLVRAPDWPITGIAWLRFLALLLLPPATWALEKLVNSL